MSEVWPIEILIVHYIEKKTTMRANISINVSFFITAHTIIVALGRNLLYVYLSLQARAISPVLSASRSTRTICIVIVKFGLQVGQMLLYVIADLLILKVLYRHDSLAAQVRAILNSALFSVKLAGTQCYLLKHFVVKRFAFFVFCDFKNACVIVELGDITWFSIILYLSWLSQVVSIVRLIQMLQLRPLEFCKWLLFPFLIFIVFLIDSINDRNRLIYLLGIRC